MNNSGTCGCNSDNCGCVKTTFYWPAVIAAGVIGVGLSFLVTLLSLAFGFSAFSMTPTGTAAFNVGGFLGLVIAAVISMFLVGWIAAFLARPYCVRKYYGELYGLTAWSLSLILSILLASSGEKLLVHTSYIVNKHSTPITFTIATENMTAKAPSLKKAPAAEKNAEALSTTSFVIFFIFFIGALISCFGGRCALHLNKQKSV